MITSFEMKNRGICSCICRLPYYAKNIFLLILLSAVLLLNYLVNFRKDKVEIQSLTKIIAGLNSQTFNFLESHDQTLFITNKLKKVSITRVTPVDFYSTCVAMSRICLL